ALEGVLREHLGRAIGEEIDRAILAGNGVNPQPLGILNHPDVPVVSIGANGGAISWSALAEADRLAMAGARGNQPGAWIMNDKVVKALRTTPRGSGLDFIMPGRDL
ncbi:MAG: phage major capsid protein, partial [Candidatus Thermofonsia Clade 3 bacterium]